MNRRNRRRLENLQRLELDVDTRLLDLWAEVDLVEEWNLEVVGHFLRAAYGAGYTQALTEVERGKLCRDHGYLTPRRGA